MKSWYVFVELVVQHQPTPLGRTKLDVQCAHSQGYCSDIPVGFRETSRFCTSADSVAELASGLGSSVKSAERVVEDFGS